MNDQAAARAPETSILLEAAEIVNGSRRESYGHPADNFANTGRMWAAMLTAHTGERVEDLPPRLVATMMVAFKCARDAHSSKRDNLVDMAGYAEAAHMAGGDA